MSEAQDLMGVEQEQPATAAKLDLRPYVTVALVESLKDLLSVPGTLRRFLVTLLLVTTAFALGYYLLLRHFELTTTPSLVIGGVSLVLGAICGVALGGVRLVRASLLNIESVLKAVMEISNKAALDYEHAQAGKIRLPSGPELVEQVYEEVVLPATEQAVAGAFGFLAAPLLWIYRRSIGLAVRYVLKRVRDKQAGKQAALLSEQNVMSGLASLAKYSEKIKTFTNCASGVIGKVGRLIRLCVLLPMYVAFVAFLSLAAVSICLFAYFASA